MRHPDVISPHFKEAQWFARGRFRKKHFSCFIEAIRFEIYIHKISNYTRNTTNKSTAHAEENGESMLLHVPIPVLALKVKWDCLAMHVNIYSSKQETPHFDCKRFNINFKRSKFV